MYRKKRITNYVSHIMYRKLFLAHPVSHHLYARPWEATGHQRPREATGGHGRPREATGGHGPHPTVPPKILYLLKWAGRGHQKGRLIRKPAAGGGITMFFFWGQRPPGNHRFQHVSPQANARRRKGDPKTNVLGTRVSLASWKMHPH